MPTIERDPKESPRSYVSLIYGVLTVLVLIAIIFLAVQLFQQRTGQITEKAGQTEGEQTYVVAKGESLWTIADKVYKDAYKWTVIAKANNLTNPDLITEGGKLVIPDITTTPTLVATTAPSATTKPAATGKPSATVKPATGPTATPTVAIGEKITGNTYTVVRGDNLWNISVRAYGDGFKWVGIAKANKLANPDLIHAGNKFTLPR